MYPTTTTTKVSSTIGSRSDYLSRKIDKTETSVDGVFKQIQDDIGTLDHLHAVSKMEPKFTELMDDVVHTAITLSNYCQDVTPIDSTSIYSEIDTQKNMDKCWGYLTELSKAIQWHIHHSYKYHKFHHAISNCSKRIEKFEEILQENQCSILRASSQGENIQSELTSIIKEIKGLSSEAVQVTPLHKRRQMLATKTYPAYLLTTLCLEDGTWIERGDVLEIACVNCPNNRLKNEWHVKVETKNGRTRAIRLPATCLWLVDEDEWPKEEDVNKIANSMKEKPCVCEEKLNNKLSVLVLKKRLENVLVDCFTVSNTKAKDYLLSNGDANSTQNYENIKDENPNVDFDLYDKEKTLKSAMPINNGVDFSNELDNMRIILNDYREFDTELSHELTPQKSENVFSANLKNEMANFFTSFAETPDRQHETLTCISNLQKPIERTNLYNTLSRKNRENSFRDKRDHTPSQLIDSNAYGIDFSHSLESSNRFSDKCPCKYCGCMRNTGVKIIKDVNNESFYQPTTEVSTISNELPVYDPKKYGTMPRYFTDPRQNAPAENIYDQTISSLSRDVKSKRGTLKGKRGKRFRKKSQHEESGVEFTPESEFEDNHLDSLPRYRSIETNNYVNPDDVNTITETLKPNGRNAIYSKTPDSSRKRQIRPNFPPTTTQTEADYRDDLLSGRERSLDSITDTVVKSRIRPGRSKSTDPPAKDTRGAGNFIDPRTMDNTIKSISRDRFSILPMDDNQTKDMTIHKSHGLTHNNISSIDDSIYPTTPDWPEDPYGTNKKHGTIRSVQDGHSNFENENEDANDNIKSLPFFTSDSILNKDSLTRPPREGGSIKSHRVQVGYPRVNSQPLKDASVQIGYTSQMGYSEYDYGEQEKSIVIKPITNLDMKETSSLGKTVEASSSAFQIGPLMVDSAVDVQTDFGSFTPKVESYGKKLQVGEPYWSATNDTSSRPDGLFNWPNESLLTKGRPFNTADSAHNPMRELMNTTTDHRDVRSQQTVGPLMSGNSAIVQPEELDGDYSNEEYYKSIRGDCQKCQGRIMYPRRKGHSLHSLCIHLHIDECHFRGEVGGNATVECMCQRGPIEDTEGDDDVKETSTCTCPRIHVCSHQQKRCNCCCSCHHGHCCCNSSTVIGVNRRLSNSAKKRSRSLDYCSIREGPIDDDQ